MATDPVCKMTVEPHKAAAMVEHRGETYYFCSQGCHKEFSAHPEKYRVKKPGGVRGVHPKEN
ncbi:MAG: hypothetical protein A2150_07475 [Candidatus Muproteobacteria bacterium RBG_16_64_11]|uniref:TRASH domain-containing protein n=1 Tax=Candidatus Muproteobacteria bacterium RBG_16_64_11 TaxID=1817758 RepID=A0A1F6TBU6_9PROT|nr:MAG: hypothetical protein A2150_07475 [Candidatus Muproteobacteria bacterium RBG_16_64_11]